MKPENAKRLKKVAFGCGSLLALFVAAIIAIVLLFLTKKKKYDKVAIPFIEEVMPVLATWDVEAFQPYWAPEVLQQIDSENLEQLFATYKRLGLLQNYEEPSFTQIASSTSNPYSSVVTYQFTADFSEGTARIECQLVPTDDGLRIWSLQINSDAFLENGPSVPEKEKSNASPLI